MGDDVHMRTQACTNLLTLSWLPPSRRCGAGAGALRGVLGGNHLFS